MSSFTRYAAVAIIVLSLGFLVASAPTPSYANVPAITGTDPVSLVCAKMFVDIETKIKALLACATIAELEVTAKVLIVVFRVCADELLKLGADVFVEVEAKASIVSCFVAIITLLCQVCVQVVLKLGIAAVATLLAEMDVCLHLLLVNLNICIGGIHVLIAQALGTETVSSLVHVHLDLCLSFLGLKP